MDVTLTAWVALAGGLVALLLLDLFVLHRYPAVISMRDAAWSTAGFIAISIAFGIGLGIADGADIAQQFFAGYALEKSLLAGGARVGTPGRHPARERLGGQPPALPLGVVGLELLVELP